MRAFDIPFAVAALSFAALSCEGKRQQPTTAPEASDARPIAEATAPAPSPGPALPDRARGEENRGEHDHDSDHDRDRYNDHDADHDRDADHDHDADHRRDRDEDHDHERDHGAGRNATPAPTSTTPAPTQAARTTHDRVGPDKCKMCHRVEYQSWSATAHAAKGLDCESCHGNGGDYWTAAVMRDRARATAAGLVVPGVATCRRCHADATPALLPRAHAHRAPVAQ